MSWVTYVGAGFAVAVAIVLGVTAFTALGIPAAPSVALNTNLQPSSAQTLSVTFQTQGYATQPQLFNGILSSAKVVYSAGYNTVGGAITMVANNSTVGLNAVNFNNGLYTLGATVTISLPATCVMTGCVGYTENLTIWATAVFNPYYTSYLSPQSKVVFSSNPAFTTKQAALSPSPNVWYWAFWGSLTAIATVTSTVVAIVTRHIGPEVGAAVFAFFLVIEFLIWIG